MLLRAFADKWNMSPTGQDYAYNYLLTVVKALITAQNMATPTSPLVVVSMSQSDFLANYDTWSQGGSSRSALFDIVDKIQATYDALAPDQLVEKAFILDFLYRMQFWSDFDNTMRSTAMQDNRDVAINDSNIDQIVLIIRNFYLDGPIATIWTKMSAIFTAATSLTTTQQAYVLSFLLEILKRKTAGTTITYAADSDVSSKYTIWTVFGLTTAALFATIAPIVTGGLSSSDPYVVKAQAVDELLRLVQRRIAAGG